jgi:DNA-binding transcriptional MocR family regulator
VDTGIVRQERTVMNETTLSPSELQQSFDKSPVDSRAKRLPKVTFPFEPTPAFIEDHIDSAAVERALRIITRYIRRGIFDPSIRQLSRALKRSARTVQRYIRALVKLGKLVVTARRVSRSRNATNVYKLVDFLGVNSKGVGDKNVTEKKGEVLKTTTPAVAGSSSPTSAKQPSPFQRHWEQFRAERRAHDEKVSAQMQAQYEAKGRNFAEMQGWRLQQAFERTRMAVAARLGMYTGPKSA